MSSSGAAAQSVEYAYRSANEQLAQSGAGPAVLIGLIGSGIRASLSPALHEHEGAALGLNYAYRIIDIPAADVSPTLLTKLLDDAQRLGFTGLNITHPFKQLVIPLLDRLSDDAQALGAVNTVLFKDGQRIGHNTDWWGFAESMRRGLPNAPRDRVVLLGAGGAGAAVAHALMMLDTHHLSVFDAEGDRASRLVESLVGRFSIERVSLVTNLAVSVSHAQGLVNATPMGMEHHPGSAIPAMLLRPALWVTDIVYFPLETQLLKDARQAHCQTLNGGGMAVFQAVEAFRLFSGIAPNSQRMLNHFAKLTTHPRSP
ncbi:MAG TPA: shikimate dehydrogenase [Magnetospirillaceae bacterium]|jgi:shikimate dehydrogenase